MTLRHLLLGVTLFFLGVVATGGATQSNAPKFNGESTTNLHLSFRPYAGAGHEDMPVEVLKFVVDVASDGTGMWVHEWRLKNRSNKDVIKIRRALFVFSESEPEKLLLRYNKMSLGNVRIASSRNWPLGECSGNYCPSGFGMLSPVKLLEPLARDGEELKGNYIICLGIDKVWFADGTSWEFEAAKDN